MTGEVLAQVALTAANILAAGPICDACLGGAFGRLGHGLTNEERARSLRGVAALVGERGKPGPCWVCGDVFGEAEAWAARARAEVGEIEFATYLCAVRPSLRWQEAERLLVERFHLAHAEPQKHAWNRTVGKAFERLAGHGTVDFSDPDVKFTIDPAAGTIEIDIASVFVYGRYRKLERGIPQTHWPCRRCRGRGCAECGGTGKQYADSVEELVGAPFVQACHASGAILHGAGREDIDARMLGSGRPFVLEIVRPHVRSIDARALGGEVNAAARGRVEVSNLRLCRRDAVGIVKETDAGKTYRARVEFEKDVSPDALVAALDSLVGDIAQRTPRRVAHRRADLVRTRRLRAARVTRSELREAEIEMVTDGGLYVKELVSGDEGRTEPSLAGRLGTAAVVRELDVLDISSDGFPDAEEVARGGSPSGE